MVKKTEVVQWLKPQVPADLSNPEAIRICQNRLTDTLKRLEKLVAPEAVDRVVKLQNELNDFSVRISLIGQVKAGKTALTNAMIGMPNLLPSDVNPWTSVITSVHMNTAQPMGKNAVFSFFTTEEWDRMVDVGGHLGEMAERANYTDELDELRAQVSAMQDRTKQRLGRNFNMLLDRYHSFLGFSPELIKKYVCLGEEDQKEEGRYADITKSAQIYIKNEDYVLPTVLCDTPGVNDPFLLREAVTLENLSSTDICVVVLSAHQAFTSVDVGLLRILMALNHEQLVLYVNRVDELQDPDTQIPEIDAYIRKLLEEQNLPKDLPIVFGSAAWAETATDDPNDLVADDSIHALAHFATARDMRLGAKDVAANAALVPGSSASAASKRDDLSGLYELQSILQEKSAVNVSRPYLNKLRGQALDLSRQSLLYLEEASTSKSSLRTDLDFGAFFDNLDIALQEADDACTEIAKELSEKVLFLMSGAFRDFLLKEKISLKSHIAAKKPMTDWQPDSEKLRRDLNLAHDEFVALAPSRVNDVFAQTAEKIEHIYGMVLDQKTKLFSIHAPQSQSPKTPTSLMRTMAIDMSSGWFSSWFKSKFDQASYIKKFENITKAEMQTTLSEMQDVYVSAFVKQIRGQLHEFLSEHIRTLQNLSLLGGEDQRAEVIRKLGVDTEIRQRLAGLETVVSDLEKLFQRPDASDVKQLKTGT